jgi:peptide methionine sulfoxide reductase msrA/msrB
MNGGRITSEEKATISTYIGVGVLVVLVAGAIYFFIFAQEKSREVTGFDPARPVPSDAILRKRLKPEQYHVVREGGTQTGFQNEYWNNEHAGIYLDVITGEPLFTSLDKFDGGLGQPTFTKPISKDLLLEKSDTSYNMERTELRSKRSDAHLGYLFPDPASPTGQRHVVNSAALRFVPIERMKKEGYEAYLPLLEKK